ncbi:hypothetical protein [Nocardiopsis sp. FIRDI 009]|uniref:hypothetical protein n=1 Tax=Nocardiopsis sp. FIRDI 009 TaxID=714197 RepID=UPI001300A2DA|nr:hypothetical protein [Nocardiopsis sp. FIRDI 009]
MTTNESPISYLGTTDGFSSFVGGRDLLWDAGLRDLVARESGRRTGSLTMALSDGYVPPAVRGLMADHLPVRFDRSRTALERMAADRAQRLFGAAYADVRPSSPADALQLACAALLEPEDVVLRIRTTGIDPLGPTFPGFHQRVDLDIPPGGDLDYARFVDAVHHHRPSAIVYDAANRLRSTDFALLRSVADEADSLLVADVTGITGLIAAGLLPNPIDDAHVVVAGTHGQLGGPPGGLILCGRDAGTEYRGRAIAPRLWRASLRNSRGRTDTFLAAQAHTLAAATTPWWREVAERTVDNARTLAEELSLYGYRPVTGGTDTHLVLVDLDGSGLSGAVAERALAEVGIEVTGSRFHGPEREDERHGLSLSVTTLTMRGFETADIRRCAELTHTALQAVAPTGDHDYVLDGSVGDSVRSAIAAMTTRF